MGYGYTQLSKSRRVVLLSVCAIALALLLDGSLSIQLEDWQIQREQTARAIESEEVIGAIQREGTIAVTAFTFSVRATQDVPWRLLRTAADARAFASEVRTMQHHWGPDTNIGGAISAAHAELDRAPCEPDQRIIDISTDGKAVREPTQAARDAAQLNGIRINAIMVGDPISAEELREDAVTMDGFLLRANSWADYPALFRRKIVLEVASR